MIEVLSQHVKELDLHDGLDDPHQFVTVRRRHMSECLNVFCCCNVQVQHGYTKRQSL